MKITTRHIDYLNIGLIIISLVVAFLIPFKLFLLAYAILGPLHYLTEINWLDGQKYFVNKRWVIWIFIAGALLFAIPFILQIPALETYAENNVYQSLIVFFQENINAIIFVVLIISLSFVVTKNNLYRWIIIGSGVVLAAILNASLYYNIWVGLFIPTFIHVYIFTILFMIYGAIKGKSIPGFISTILALMVPFIILLIDINPSNYSFSELIKNTYLGTNFHVVSAKISAILGLSDGSQFFFYEKIYLKIQIFLAFAYTYHFLNWYSKTSIIGWTKNLTSKRFIVVGILWLVSMGLYWYDYKTGFLLLVFLSILHVFVEFPLNVISIKGIFQGVKGSISK